MANPLPILRGTTGGLNAQVLYPFTRSVRFTTTITTHMNGSEQRWPHHPPLAGFDLPFSSLNATDRAAWLALHSTVVGRFAKNLTITLGSTVYANLTSMSDDLAQTNRINLFADQEIHLRQVQNGSWTPPVALTAYPTLGLGVLAELPYVQISTFLTSINENPNGPRYAYSWYGASLTNFPSGYLRVWKLSYPLLNDADILTIENAFTGWMGRSLSFTFTDPIDSTLYSHVRCDQDELQIRAITNNQWSMELTLRQTNGS